MAPRKMSGIPVVSIAVVSIAEVSIAVVSIAVVIIAVPEVSFAVVSIAVVSIAVVCIGVVSIAAVSIAEPNHVMRLQCSNLQLSCGSSPACHAAQVWHSGSQHCGTSSQHCGSQHCGAASCHTALVLGRVENFRFRIYTKILRKVLIGFLQKKLTKFFYFRENILLRMRIRIQEPTESASRSETLVEDT
jgi:hypothetical protein